MGDVSTLGITTILTDNMASATDFKPIILSELDVLRRISVTETAGVFKARSYAAAIQAISGWGPIYSLTDVPPGTKRDGIGAEIRKKIERIVTTGSLDIPADVRARAVALELFTGIYGVGPKKAQDLIAAGYRTVAELRAAPATLFNKNQRIGLQYYEQLLERIPRDEMDRHAALLMATKPAALRGEIVGSYRRRAATSGDIDMLLTAVDAETAAAALADFVAALQGCGYIREVLAFGSHKCMAIAALEGGVGRRLDLLVSPPGEFPFAVLYFTGCDTFNVAMRSHALTLGFTLNEHALTHVRTGTTVQGIRSERDILSSLRLAWREPWERTGADAVVVVLKK